MARAEFDGLLADYLEGLHRKRALGAGTAETSYYGVLENLLEGVGRTLKPKVHCLPQLADVGSGRPDYGLYARTRSSAASRVPGRCLNGASSRSSLSPMTPG